MINVLGAYNICLFLHSTLVFNGLKGTISTVIGLLSSLDEFSIAINEVEGTLPTEVGLLRRITFLDIDDNKLTGPLPDEIGDMTNLGTSLSKRALSQFSSDFHLSDSSFRSFSLCKIGRFFFGKNSWSGGLPSVIGKLTRLGALAFQYGNIEGPFPTSIGELSLLRKYAVFPPLLCSMW